MSDARAYTKEEVINDLIYKCRELASYWSKVDNENFPSTKDKILGAFHSFLSHLDGCSFHPSFDLVLRPHPEDKDYHIENGENYYEDGMAINDDVMLHELLYQDKIK